MNTSDENNPNDIPMVDFVPKAPPGSMKFNIEMFRTVENNVPIKDKFRSDLGSLNGFQTIVSSDKGTITSNYPNVFQRDSILSSLRGRERENEEERDEVDEVDEEREEEEDRDDVDEEREEGKEKKGKEEGTRKDVHSPFNGSVKVSNSFRQSIESSDVFYETSPVEYGFDNISLTGEIDYVNYSPTLIEDDQVVDVEIKPYMVELLPFNGELDLSPLIKNKNLNCYGPLCDVIEYNDNGTNDEFVLLSILEYEDQLVHNELDPPKIQEQEPVSLFKRLFVEQDEETVLFNYYETYPWSRFIERVEDVEELEEIEEDQLGDLDVDQFSYLFPISLLDD